MFLFGILYVELKYWSIYISSPNSSIPFAAPQSKTNLFKQFLKLILPFYVTIDFNGYIQKEFVAILAIYYLIMLI
jgi:hypothetical protein